MKKAIPQEQPGSDTRASEDAFVAAIARNYAPSDLAPQRRAALETQLWERIETSKRRPFLVPGLCVAGAALAVLVTFIIPGRLEPERFPTSPVVASAPAPQLAKPEADPEVAAVVVSEAKEEGGGIESWEYQLMDPAAAIEAEIGSVEAPETLPEVYEAIAVAFLDY